MGFLWPIRSISLGVHGPWVAVFWVAVALALVLAIWAYRAPVPPLPRGSRVLFGLLRFAALALLILTLFQPVVTVASRNNERPILPVLLDRSTSMNLPTHMGSGDSTTRFQVARQVLAGLLPELARDFDLRLYGFGEGLDEIPLGEGGRLPPELAAGGTSTALGPALTEVLAHRGRRPSALLLLSDGAANSGSDPVAAAERLAVPIICIPASLDSVVNDIWVAECLANRDVFLGQETGVSVTIASQLALSTRVNVILREDERVLARQSITLPAGSSRTPLELRFRPERLGVHRCVVEVERAPGELTLDNNRRAFAIEVAEERLQVLLIADAMSWDVTFIRRILASDRTVSVTALARLDPRRSEYQRLGQGKLSGLPSRPGDLAPFGAVVLVGVNPSRLPVQAREALLGFAHAGGGLLVVAAGDGEALSGFAAGGWAGVLPVRLRPGREGGDVASLKPTAAGLIHPVTSLGEGPTSAADLWKNLPPIRVGGALDAGLASDVLVVSEGSNGQIPVIVAGRGAGGRVLLVNGSLVWRWGFLLPGMNGSDLVFRRFWGEAVRWLAEGRGGGNLELFADQSVFLGGKRVTLGARLTDDQLRPVDDAEVTVDVIGESGDPVKVRLTPSDGRGQYSGEAGFLKAGLYRLKGSAQRGDHRWTATGEHFLVDQASIEGASPAANPDLLRRLAERTGGELVSPEKAQSMVKAMVERQLAAVRTVEVKIWNHAGMFMAFVGCVSIEWFLRRRRGLA